MSNAAMRRAWIEVDTRALVRNFLAVRSELSDGCRVLPMVKADGYGLGARRVLRALLPEEPWGAGVATAAEGERLRREGWTGRIVVFSSWPPADGGLVIAEDLEPVVSSCGSLEGYAEAASRAGVCLPIHVKIDTGMSRFGFPWNDASWVEALSRRIEEGRVRVESTLTHFHTADDVEATTEQWRRFGRVLEALRAAGAGPGLVHAASSTSLARYPEFQADMVRPGLSLYGGGGPESGSEPVIAVRARVLEVREVPEGTAVSYGATYRTGTVERLATLAIGYGDGLRRELSNRGRVLLGGGTAPIRGSVCMDSTIVDVTGLDVGPGDVATLLGSEGEREIRIDEMAALCGTIDYEILTGWSPRLPRVELGAGTDGGVGA
ncbi:MAG: alanine racemase [Gemmatimonadota bacterium]